ncbi:hypothetical protein CIB93_36365 [Streptomyces sp. WZ.A104]|uniref:TPR repeat region-containing protein n=1 Tax=Streptomyces sp. WZ.A104 TaxID=2023771 RepID=UPI000BBC6FE6|nr:hypothetical protein [Streptomyces sp. WZ.A104]PCG81258.1 hypothetical protein CIB93_36365 [Streptomyces sp. WZ.A104]
MSGFTITRAMLVEAAGCDPYELRTDFKKDTDPEAVDALASIFKNGAEEAAETGSVSQYASDLEQRAGTRGSNAIYEDGAAHLEQTYDDLGEAGLRVVSTTLGEIKEEMEATRTYVDDSIVGEMGLEYWREWYAGQANEEIESLEDDLNSLGPETRYSWSGHGESHTSEVEDFPRANVRSIIENAYTDRAGKYGADVYDRMTDELDDYYGFLSNREDRLAEDGYDTGSTPLDLWYSEGRAEYEGEQLALELERENPDPAAVARYTQGLEDAMGGVLDENGEMAVDPEQLTEEQLAYLTGFYDSLGSEGLAALGELESDPNRDGPAAAEAIQTAQRAAANGINVMTNPEVGGLDTHQPSHFDRLPEPIAAMVRDPDDIVNKPFEEQIEHYRLFDGFGDLMGNATARAGTGFSQDLAYAALWAENGVDLVSSQAGAGDLEMSGASAALRSVALNDVASATLINDDYFREWMLSASWEDPGAAGDLIRSATLPAEGDDPRGDQRRAAFNLLESIARGQDTLSSLSDLEGNPYGAATADMQAAVKDVSLGYLDYLTEVSGRQNGDSSLTYSYFDEEGNQFRLSADHRHELFMYLGKSEQSVLNQWETGLETYYTVRAADAFGEGSSESDRQRILGNLGALDGAVAGAYDQIVVDVQDDEDKAAEQRAKQRLAAATAITGVGAAVATGGVATTSWGLAAAGVGAAGSLAQNNPEAPALAADLNYDSAVVGDWSLRRTVAEAAIGAGYGSEELADYYNGRSIDEADGEGNPAMVDINHSDLQDVLDTVEATYTDSAGKLGEAYSSNRRASGTS